MPSIASRLVSDSSTLAPPTVASVAALPTTPALSSPSPTRSTSLISPLPNIGPSATPDNLRQYYAGGAVPQYRLNPASPLSSASSGSAGAAGAKGSAGPAGPTGPAGGVIQIVEGANVTISPLSGVGVVTISATGGGGGGNPQDFSQVFQVMGG